MSLLILSVSILFLSITGFGLGLWRIFGLKIPRERNTSGLELSLISMTGVVLWIWIATVLNFWWPLSMTFARAMIVLGIIFFLILGRTLWSKSQWCWLFVTIVFVVLSELRPIEWYDTGLYHLQEMQWRSAGPIVRGLANLHLGFGTNSTLFGGAIWSEWVPSLRGYGSYVFNAVLLSGVFFSALVSIQNSRDTKLTQGILVLSTYFAHRFLMREMPSLSTDLPVTLIELVALAALVDIFSQEKSMSSHAWVVLGLLMSAVTIKISAAFFLAGGCVLILYRYGWKKLGGMAFLAVMTMSPWWMKGILTSGCWLYPYEHTCINSLDYRIPKSLLDYGRLSVHNWSHSQVGGEHEAVEKSVSWLIHWFLRWAGSPEFMGLWFLSVLALGLIVIRRKSDASFWSAEFKKNSPILFMLGLGMAAWVATAPDIRFGRGYVMGVLLLLTLPVLLPWWMTRSPRTRFRSGIWYLVVMVSSSHLVRNIQSSGFDLPKTKVLNVDERMTRDGELILVARWQEGGTCGNMPIPCAHVFRPDIHIERNGKGRIHKIWFGSDPEPIPKESSTSNE